MTALSGGQAARAGLAALLLSRYDVLLLDEPTNDLDLDGLERLERFVTGLRSPAVIVSHDREFLARTVNRIVELDLAQQRVGVYEGGYDSYLAEREVARRHAREAYEEYDDKRGALKDRAVMQRNWMAQGVRNARRKATDPDKHVKAFRQQTSEKQAAKARQTERAIERLEVVEEPRKEWELRMTIAAAPRSGTVVASLPARWCGAGRSRSGRSTPAVDWADRVVITGANGSGKSTLLGALLGRIPLDEGSGGLGSSVRVGEIDQARGLFLGPSRWSGRSRDAVPGLAGERRPHAAGEVRADRRARAPAGGLALAGRADAGGAGAAAGARGEPAGARRADQPPRPARDRAAGTGARRVPGHGAAGHARPPDARERAQHAALGHRRRPAARGVNPSDAGGRAAATIGERRRADGEVDHGNDAGSRRHTGARRPVRDPRRPRPRRPGGRRS